MAAITGSKILGSLSVLDAEFALSQPDGDPLTCEFLSVRPGMTDAPAAAPISAHTITLNHQPHTPAAAAVAAVASAASIIPQAAPLELPWIPAPYPPEADDDATDIKYLSTPEKYPQFAQLTSHLVADACARFHPSIEGDSKATHAAAKGVVDLQSQGIKAAASNTAVAVIDNIARNDYLNHVIADTRSIWSADAWHPRYFATLAETFPGGRFPAYPDAELAAAHMRESLGLFNSAKPLLSLIESYMAPFPLTMYHQTHSEQGSRKTQEDTFFALPALNAFGVIDGHHGARTAVQARKLFCELLPVELTQAQGNGCMALQSICTQIGRRLINYQEGAVAAAVHVDPLSGLLSIATVGDCAVLLFRKINGITKCIQPGRLIDWAVPSEIRRTKENAISYASPLPLPCNLHCINSTRTVTGANSRAFGDAFMKPLVSFEPAMSLYLLQPGDIVLIMTDGYLFLKEGVKEICQQIDAKQPNLAQTIAQKAAAEKQSDNCTVVELRFS